MLSVVLDSNEKARDSYGQPDREAGSSDAPIAGLANFLRRPLVRVKPAIDIVIVVIQNPKQKGGMLGAKRFGGKLSASVRLMSARREFALNTMHLLRRDRRRRAFVDFSLGRTDYRQVMRELRIDGDEALLLLMAGAGLPMPKLAKEETMKMVEDCERVLQRVGL